MLQDKNTSIGLSGSGLRGFSFGDRPIDCAESCLESVVAGMISEPVDRQKVDPQGNNAPILQETFAMIRIQNSGVVAALAVSMMFAAATAQAEMMKFTTEMTGIAQVPPNDSAATGTAEVTIDTEAKTVTWIFTHEGLSGDMTAAHVHGPATATETAGPVIDTSGETMEGSAPITDAQAAELMAGMYYFNVHTEKFPDGEIRGQLALMQ